MSTPSEKLGVNLEEAVATLEQLMEQIELEKSFVSEKDEEIEKLKRELEAEKSKLRATRLAIDTWIDKSNASSEDGSLMIFATELNITWSEYPQYWTWTTVSESRSVTFYYDNNCNS